MFYLFWGWCYWCLGSAPASPCFSFIQNSHLGAVQHNHRLSTAGLKLLLNLNNWRPRAVLRVNVRAASLWRQTNITKPFKDLTNSVLRVEYNVCQTFKSLPVTLTVWDRTDGTRCGLISTCTNPHLPRAFFKAWAWGQAKALIYKIDPRLQEKIKAQKSKCDAW